MKAFLLSPKGLLLCYLLLVNLVTFLTFGYDKRQAKVGHWRVPEKTLFLLSAIGGSIGALLGMQAFHHKTRHRSFRFGIPAILIGQVLVAACFLVDWSALRVEVLPRRPYGVGAIIFSYP